MRGTSIAVLSALVGLFTSAVTVYGAPKNHDTSSDIVVIQGTVQAINQNVLTIVTDNWQSYPHGDVTDGSVTYKVNVAHAVEETYSGMVVKPQVGVGEVIVAVGHLTQNEKKGNRAALNTALNMNAVVIEESAGGSSPSGNSVTQTVLRIHLVRGQR